MEWFNYPDKKPEEDGLYLVRETFDTTIPFVSLWVSGMWDHRPSWEELRRLEWAYCYFPKPKEKTAFDHFLEMGNHMNRVGIRKEKS